jgi:hypothetical protein
MPVLVRGGESIEAPASAERVRVHSGAGRRSSQNLLLKPAIERPMIS